jgi:hypothetical protein
LYFFIGRANVCHRQKLTYSVTVQSSFAITAAAETDADAAAQGFRENFCFILLKL